MKNVKHHSRQTILTAAETKASIMTTNLELETKNRWGRTHNDVAVSK